MTHSVTIAPFDAAELWVLRSLAAVDRGFDEMAAMVLRLELLRAIMGGSLGHRAERGLALAERAAVLAFAARLAADVDGLRLKAMLVRCHASGSDDAVAAMLTVALEDDCRRLGLLMEDMGGDEDGEPACH